MYLKPSKQELAQRSEIFKGGASGQAEADAEECMDLIQTQPKIEVLNCFLFVLCSRLALPHPEVTNYIPMSVS